MKGSYDWSLLPCWRDHLARLHTTYWELNDWAKKGSAAWRYKRGRQTSKRYVRIFE